MPHDIRQKAHTYISRAGTKTNWPTVHTNLTELSGDSMTVIGFLPKRAGTLETLLH